MTGPTLGGILALTLTHSVLLPVLDQNWRQLMTLWGAVTVAAAALWWLIATLAGRSQPGLHAAPASAADGTERITVSRLLRIPGVALVLVMSVGVFALNHGLNNWLPELLRSTGMSATEAGYWAALPMLVGLVGSLVIPRLATPERRFAILLGLCLAAAIACVLLTIDGELPLVSALLVQGLVRSSLMTVLILTLMELPGMSPTSAGTASGLFFSAAEVGGVLGPLGLGLAYDLTQGFNAGLYALTAISVLMMLATVRIGSQVRRSAQRPLNSGGRFSTND